MKWHSKVTQDDKQCHCSIYHAGLPLAFHGIYIPSLVLFRYSKILVKNSQFFISYLHLAPIENNLVGILQISSIQKIDKATRWVWWYVKLFWHSPWMWRTNIQTDIHADRQTDRHTDRQTDRHFTVWLTVLQEHIPQLHKMCRALKTNM